MSSVGTAAPPYSSRKYIDDIPPDQRANLCTEIDYTIHQNEGYWPKLLRRLGFGETDSKKFQLSFEMRASPTDNLLRDCSYRMLRLRHLYQILMEIGLVHVAQEYLSKYDTEEALPPCPGPSLNFSTNNFSLAAGVTNTEQVKIDNDKECSSKSSNKGASWNALNTYHFSYENIKKGTECFSPKTELGAGAFGKVYRVKLNNTLFACKVLKIDNGNALATSIIETHRQHDDLRNELNFLAEYRHPNVIALYGWSLDGPDPCLIYDYMKNGSLQDCLHYCNVPARLSWKIRLKVACGSARGLQFLHTMKSKPLIHGDIKTANILLDDSFTAKLGDFGLAREMPRNATTGSYIRLGNEHTPGTLGYLANEYITTKKLSVQVDTYAFGVVLLELYTGRRAYDRHSVTPLLRDLVHDYADEAEEIGEEKADQKLLELLDPSIPKLPRDLALKFVKLALRCCHAKRKERPKMSNTLAMLEEIANSLAVDNGLEVENYVPHLLESIDRGNNRLGNEKYCRFAAPAQAHSVNRVPVESVDNSLSAGDALQDSTKSSTTSLEKQMEQARISFPSSSEDSDPQNHLVADIPANLSSPPNYMGSHPNHYLPHQGLPTYNQGGVHQYGYYSPPHMNGGYSGSVPIFHPPQFQYPHSNIIDTFLPPGYLNSGWRSIRPSDSHDIYAPGPCSCPAHHGNKGGVEKNPYNLDLSRAPKLPCTCNGFQIVHQNVSPQLSMPWPGPIDCAPETFTSTELNRKGVKQFVRNENQNFEASNFFPAASAIPGPSHATQNPRQATELREYAQFPPLNSIANDDSHGEGGRTSTLPVSINPVKESLLDKLRDGQNYTQIFNTSSRASSCGDN